MMEKKVIMVFGPPGSGKGTQAKLLAEKLGFFHFITSAVGKEYIAIHNDPETQKQIELYKEGSLWESQWLIKIIEEKTKEIFKNYLGIIYDGYPRTLDEAEHFYLFLKELISKENVEIIEISVSNEEIKKRLAKRLICDRNSEHVFIHSEKLKVGDSCPQGDGILIERDLDKKEEVINTRLLEYKNQTIPALDFLKNNYTVIIINGEQSIEDVFKDILKAIK